MPDTRSNPDQPSAGRSVPGSESPRGGGSSPGRPGPSVLTLRHLTGERRGQVERFDAARVSIGRGVNNHCAFDSRTERSVSHRHCELRLEGPDFVIYDIGSLNGTYLNGRRVRRSVVRDGDEIGLGREGPRMRVTLHSGLTPGPIAPGELTPYQPTPMPYGGRRIPAAGILVAAVVFACIGAGLTYLWTLKDRLDRLEASKTGPEAGLESGDAGRRPPATLPANAPRGPRGATVLVVGATLEDSGRVLTTRELGAGVVAGVHSILSTRLVFERALEFLDGLPSGTSGRIAVRLDGRTDCELTVLAGTILPEKHGEPLSQLLLLHLAETDALARLPVAPMRRGRASWYPPGQQMREGLLLEGRSLDNRAVSIDEAVYVAIDGLEGPTGLPLFDGSHLVGIALGASRPELAIASPSIEEFLRTARNLPASPLTR